MWSNPRLLRLVADALFALAGLLVALAAGQALIRSSAFALRAIEVHGDLAHVRHAQIVAALQGRVSGTFFTVDLDRVRERFESIAWVRRAEVQRHWPDRLVVRLEEHVALARWGRREDGLLVNLQGELFSAIGPDDLPLFSGPPGSEREVTRRYAQFSALLAPLGMPPQQVLLSERLAWQVRTEDGLVLQLGRDAPRDGLAQRLERFVAAYPRTLGRADGRLERTNLRVDLRYPNGFAVRVPGIERTGPATKARGA